MAGSPVVGDLVSAVLTPLFAVGMPAGMAESDSSGGERDVLTLRRSEVLALIEAKEDEVVAADRLAAARRQELAALRSLLGMFGARAGEIPFPQGERPTIRDMAKDVLRMSGEPMGVRQMINAIFDRFDRHVARTSLSPILKKMERRGEVRHVGDRWEIAHEKDFDEAG